jgi:hypothetical protein
LYCSAGWDLECDAFATLKASFSLYRPPHNLRQIRGQTRSQRILNAGIALRAISVEHFPPFHHVALAAVLLDQPGHAVMPPTPALGAFDAEHVELAFDVTEDEMVSREQALSD